MYGLATIEAKLAVQRGINPTDATSCTLFRDFAVNLQQFPVYLAMLGGQPHITMVHTLGVYNFINLTASTYQGRVLAFIGDRRVTKEPNPVCMPTTKNLGVVFWQRGPTLQPSRTTLLSRQAAAPCGHWSWERIPLGPSRYHTCLPSPMSLLTCSAQREQQSCHMRC